MQDNRPSAAGPRAGSETPSGTVPPERILVVDDDSSIRQLHTSSLLRCGYEVDAVENGADAWEALLVDSYDLVITDNNMPKVSGVELLKKLRAARMSLPVIMATASVPHEEFSRYPWLRPAATLPKPYTLDQLLSTVQEVLRDQQAPPTADDAAESAAG